MADPWMKFFTSDWRSDPRLKMCSAGARGVWIEMICLMHESTPYGHLLVYGQTPNEAQLASLTGIPFAELNQYLAELERMGVFSRTREGVIYSRKLVRMAKKAAEARKTGQSGGNPKLTAGYAKPGYVYAIGRRNDGAVKIGVSVNPSNRIKKIRAQYRGHDLHIMGSIWVDDMGSYEGTLHEDLISKSAGGEWFQLTDNDLKRLGFIKDPYGSSKGDPLPQKPEAIYQKDKEPNGPLSLPTQNFSDPVPVPERSKPPPSRGSRLSKDWVLSREYGEAAVELGMSEQEIRNEADRFRDYWIAKTGRDATKADWLATWRNWCRKFISDRRPYRGTRPPPIDARTFSDL